MESLVSPESMFDKEQGSNGKLGGITDFIEIDCDKMLRKQATWCVKVVFTFSNPENGKCNPENELTLKLKLPTKGSC